SATSGARAGQLPGNTNGWPGAGAVSSTESTSGALTLTLVISLDLIASRAATAVVAASGGGAALMPSRRPISGPFQNKTAQIPAKARSVMVVLKCMVVRSYSRSQPLRGNENASAGTRLRLTLRLPGAGAGGRL